MTAEPRRVGPRPVRLDDVPVGVWDGRRLAAARARRGWTQLELARRIALVADDGRSVAAQNGTERRTQQWERPYSPGRVGPTIASVYRLQAALECTWEELLGPAAAAGADPGEQPWREGYRTALSDAAEALRALLTEDSKETP